MPAKKNQINGFWLFAQSNRGKWKAQGLQVGSNDQILAIANPIWKSLGVEERKCWDARAKEERKLRRDEKAYERLDNTGSVLGTRKDPVEEARKRRERDIAETTSKWEGKDLKEEKFYFINFQEMCETTVGESEDRTWLPRELAISEFCLQHGNIRFYHQFIWPTSIPLGFRLKAEQRSTEYHRIPVEEMEIDSHDYAAIFREIKEMIKGGMSEGRYPPLYCLASDYDKTKYLCDWLWRHSGAMTGPRMENPIGRVHALEDMVTQLLAWSGNPDTNNIATFQIVRNLDGSQWDYIETTPCDFHSGVDVSRFCALGFVRKAGYTVSDMVAQHYGIEIGENHVPVREEPSRPAFRFLPSSLTGSRGPAAGRGPRRGGYNIVEDKNNPRTYTQLARPRAVKESSDSEDGNASSSSQGSDWPRPRSSGPSALAGRVQKKIPDAPVRGQFADNVAWKGIGKQADENDDEFPTPSQQMGALRVREEAPPSLGMGRMGPGTNPAAAASAAAPTYVTRPRPGFRPGGGGRGMVPEGGEGVMTEADFPSVLTPDLPRQPAQPAAVIGRGRGEGRGSLLRMGEGRGQSQAPVGRGRIRRGARSAVDSGPQGVLGAASPVGRGSPSAGVAGFGPAPSLPSFVTGGPALLSQSFSAAPPGLSHMATGEHGHAQSWLGNEAAGPEFGREASARQVMGGAQVSMVSTTFLDEDTDNFEPYMPTAQPSFHAGAGGDNALFRAPGMGNPSEPARQVNLGRGMMPRVRGRGSLPKPAQM